MARKISGLWFCIHFALEVICFQFYTSCFHSTAIALAATLIYDIIAFFPQFAIGALVTNAISFGIGLLLHFR